MASIIEGYTYDIFVSYRQKDNKYDGWVTEFVDNLKRELESMFKEEVSVYFDVNPSDYLLESYDVNASLKDKLKCLVFIPIISRTYCDPKSFAWDNELRAFISLASRDSFGFKVKLPGGNVSNRVLPIRIHDLDPADIKLFESAVDGVIRSIDFVYKETGVNRQLRAKDDDIIIKTSGQNLYRDQINKVALAIKEIIESMKLQAGQVILKEIDIKVKQSEEKKDSDIEREPGEKIIKPEKEVIEDKIVQEKAERRSLWARYRILVPVIMAVLIILVGLIFLLNHQSKVRWAKEVALPEIEKLITETKTIDAFNLAQKAEKYISKNPKYQELAAFVTGRLTILSDPQGADIYIRKYSDVNGEWVYLGKTPADTVKLPFFTPYLVKLEKSGYDSVTGVSITQLIKETLAPDTLFRKLFKKGYIPEGMVYVEGYGTELANNFLKKKHGFFMDRYEVTNKQFKEFVDKGGYVKRDYWKNAFIKDGKPLAWEKAITYFKDKSGRPGPATWEGGYYPEGQDNYPVSGVSWYEAAAFAEFAEKSLPTLEHWRSGAGFPISYIGDHLSSNIIPLSNFNGKGPETVEKSHGISCFGVSGMAGNVKEWCYNNTSTGDRIILGGAFDDVVYMFSSLSQLAPFDRSSKNGFRCVQYIDKEKLPSRVFDTILFTKARDISKEIPVNDNIFKVYKNQFLYDKTDLKAVIEKRDESPDNWAVEKISFNAAYENERMIAYLFLPKNGSPPFQTLIFFPGSNARDEKDLLSSVNSYWFFDFLLKNNRAVMYPVYKGTFERNFTLDFPMQSHQYANWIVKITQDLSRSIDYLDTRTDIDTKKLGYIGQSWGGRLGLIIPAVEERLKLSVLIVGGSTYKPFPEVDPFNYVPRIKIPVLMLNGKYDVSFPFETAVKPYFNLLGTPDKDKNLILYETDHYVPKSEIIKETLNWIDKYFGPAK
jgi:hypothetical protein